MLPVVAETKVTVPLLLVKAPPVLRSEPPIVSVPVGNTVVPPWSVIEPDAVAFVSANVHVPLPANNRLYALEPLNVTVCAVDAVNLSVPELWENDPPVFANAPPIANVPDGIVSVPVKSVTLRELVALALAKLHDPEPLNARS